MSTDDPLKSFLAATQQAADNTSPDKDIVDKFWSHESIEAARWNQAFPYQLVLVKRGKNGNYYQDDDARKWSFTLPFPPESLSITMPFAINGMVTQGGYAEEHGGAPIRMINLNGTLGVLPLRGVTSTNQVRDPTGLFAGTLQQIQRVATTAQNIVGTVQPPNLVPDSTFLSKLGPDAAVAKTSGYYQMRLLQQFFENYVAFRQTTKGRDYRLALCLFKQQSVYLVTPQSYVSQQAADSPLEYRYTLVFRAWRRISLDSIKAVSASAYRPTALKPNAVQAVLKVISDARELLANARGVLAAVGGDLDHALFEPLRQVSMFLKGALSVPLAFADLPVQLLADCQDAIVQYVSVRQAFEGASERFRDEAGRVVEAYRALGAAGAASGRAETGAAPLPNALSTADPAYDVFRHPEDHYAFFAGIKPAQVNLPPKAVRSIVREREQVRQLKRLDFEQFRDSAVQVMADFADAIGAGNATYDRTFHRAGRTTSKTPTPADFQIVFALNRVVMELNRLAASGTVDQRLRSVDFVAGLAAQSGIAFTIPRSKFAVPYPYGVTLEQVAQRYLGDPDRWIEIATLNGLRAPYVDEEGFDLLLQTNGFENQVTIADSSELYIGQPVWISAADVSRTMRHITKIERLSVSTSVITLDGEPDLGRFHTNQSAVLHAFLPNTVNSMQMIYIPSDEEPADADYQTKDVPSLDVFDELLNTAGFDLLLTSSNDLAVTPDGDCRLAVGLANVIQTARIRLSVPQGMLHRHPEFGLPIKIGESVADLDAKALLKAAQNLFNDDPVFTGVQSASVRITGPAAQIAMTVGIRGQQQVIPLTFDLKR